MNYMGFALPVRAFWRAGRGLSPGAAGRRVRAVDGRLPRRAAARPPADPVQPVGQPRYRAFSHAVAGNAARMQMAAVWLLSWIGVPCLYYGDEIGLDGGNDPFCRKPFPWDVGDWDRPLLALFQRMAALRKQSVALRRGGCQVLYASGETLVRALPAGAGAGGAAARRQRAPAAAQPAVGARPVAACGRAGELSETAAGCACSWRKSRPPCGAAKAKATRGQRAPR